MAKTDDKVEVKRFGVTNAAGDTLMKSDGKTPMTFNTKKAAQMEADRLGGAVVEPE